MKCVAFFILKLLLVCSKIFSNSVTNARKATNYAILRKQCNIQAHFYPLCLTLICTLEG